MDPDTRSTPERDGGGFASSDATVKLIVPVTVVKGSEKPKKSPKKQAQKTLKERRSEKRAAKKLGGG